MQRASSLRMRLTLIILLPLLALSILVGFWELRNAQATAKSIFDKSMLSAALAVANDVAISDGDALSPRTTRLLTDTSGGQIFYHVYGPDGVIVAGYARPPAGIPRAQSEVGSPDYFEATYLGQDVSGVRLLTQTEIDGFSGVFTTTVWQPTNVRTAFVQEQVANTFIVIAIIVLSAALIVWFGVRIGLRPLNSLMDAIEQRSSTELSPIRRAVPIEVRGIVDRLNRLFGQVSDSMTRQSEFISDAAHQLRNPIAGLLSMAEAVNASSDEATRKSRARDLLFAAKEATDLTEKLLMLERAKSLIPEDSYRTIDLNSSLTKWLSLHPNHALFEWNLPPKKVEVSCDPYLVREAVLNLIDNSVRHGGPDLSAIKITLKVTESDVQIQISDNGVGIPEHLLLGARERFKQISETSNTGLGLSFVESVANAHGGHLEISSGAKGLSACISMRRFVETAETNH